MVKRMLLRSVVMTAIIIGFIIILLTDSHFIHANSNGASVTNSSTSWGPFVWAIVIIGGSIGITLSYVSWRKYKGERTSRRKSKDKLID